jgi:acetolactate decarboxylase
MLAGWAGAGALAAQEGQPATPPAAAKRAVWQNQPYISLVNGHYQATGTVDKAKEHGDQGIGALAGLGGEFLVLDGTLYQFPSTGGVRLPDGKEEVGFAMLAPFKRGESIELRRGTRLKDLPCLLARLTPNAWYGLRIEGEFATVSARTFVKQQEPYQPVCKLNPPAQPFQFTKVEGTMVGFRSPVYATDVSGPMVHLHFLRKDLTGGGHVLDLMVQKATLFFDRVDSLALDLPTDAAFSSMDLSQWACPKPVPDVCPAPKPKS